MNHIQFNITANEKEQEELISFLSELGATGFEQNETQLIAYFEEGNFNSDEVHGVLKKFAFSTTTVAEQNWNAVWESNFEPITVGNFCGVRAHFHQPIKNVQHEIVITPKMSFGTGHHATTFMMMEQMQAINFKDKEVFDFGTGTGILAILAEKLGAAKVTAIDNDAWSFENVQENIQKNNCTKIEASLTEQLPQHKSFDIVLANINKNVLLQYMDILKSCTKQNGLLLLSGLLASDENDIVSAYEKVNFKLQKQLTNKNWISLLFVNA